MGKIKIEFESVYNKNDVVIFKKCNGNCEVLLCGVITSYYCDCDVIWYTISVGENGQMIYTYNNGGDVAEFDIIGKIDEISDNKPLNDSIRQFVYNDNYI